MTTQSPVMSIEQLAQNIKRCVENQQYEEAYRQYFSPDMVSVEPQAGPDGSRETQGMQGIAQKGEMWAQSMDTHAVEVSEPLVIDQHFVLKYRFDVTQRQTGARMWMQELALYEVNAEGKIIREEFFYPACNN